MASSKGSEEMIHPQEAIDLIAAHVKKAAPELLHLAEAAGHILAADVYAAIDLPPFIQSSVDGYALTFDAANKTYEVWGEMAAGAPAQIAIAPATATRIFTGAPLPAGADTVVMQEHVQPENGRITINDIALTKGANVRPQGIEIRNGDLAMHKGIGLSPAAIGYLAGLGVTTVSVYPSPAVAIIVTGNELQTPGTPLAFGQVYESNAAMLIAALGQAGFKELKVHKAPDHPEVLKALLAAALDESDLVLLTGGVSVGYYDFVPQAAAQCGVQPVFHKIRQRPGKPLYYGMKEEKIVFGLPGNPSSVLNCFYLYVLPALGIITGKNLSLKKTSAWLSAAYSKNTKLTHFMKGRYDNGVVSISGAQESFRLSSFAQANCLIELPESQSEYAAGETITIHLLPS